MARQEPAFLTKAIILQNYTIKPLTSGVCTVHLSMHTAMEGVHGFRFIFI